MDNKRTIPTTHLPLNHIHNNEGQVEGIKRNPREIDKADYERLVRSLKEDPEMLSMREILVYRYGKDKYIAIGGNMRLRALRELGYETAPCKIIPDATPLEAINRYIIKDNGAFGRWDQDLLANEWDAELLKEWGAPVEDWNAVPEEKEKAEDDNFDETKEDIPSITKPGDIWRLGDHRLMCGDSTLPEHVQKLVGGGTDRPVAHRPSVQCQRQQQPRNEDRE